MVGQPSRAPVKRPLQWDGLGWEARAQAVSKQELLTALSPTLPAPTAPLLPAWDVQ